VVSLFISSGQDYHGLPTGKMIIVALGRINLWDLKKIVHNFFSVLNCCLQGQEDLCETFFKYNRGMGGLYDGTTRLYRSSNGTHSPNVKHSI
jgi:hypothetical protein